MGNSANSVSAAKSVIEIWLMGGPSHLELFDPKPDAPKEYNNGLKSIETNVPGFRIHEWLPKLASCADLYSVIRSMTHPYNGHETAVYLMQTGHTPGGRNVRPAIGSFLAMEQAKRGNYHGDLPPSVILTESKGRFSELGSLDPVWEPLVTGGDPNSYKFTVDGITPPGGLSEKDIVRRFALCERLDTLPISIPAFEQAGQDARRTMAGDGAKAFDLSLESKAVRDAYGRTTFGQSLLVARRLVEYGVPYVTVNLTGWDSHKRHFDTMGRKTNMLDTSVAALLRDLKEKKLLDTTLVWMTGEFGRRPKADFDPPWNGGRNHYAKCFCALVAGGGFVGGKCVGESDARGENVVSRPVSPSDFLGSICERCGVDPTKYLPPPSTDGLLRELYA